MPSTSLLIKGVPQNQVGWKLSQGLPGPPGAHWTRRKVKLPTIVKLQAKQDAQRNIQEIERNIHYENQKLTEKTMSQRYTLDYYKREKSKLDL